MSLDWLDDLQALGARGEACILVSVVRAEGSTPREAGARMLVSASARFGTIGGGQLELTAIATAREMLREAMPGCRLRQYTLGANLGQCCGGVVWLLAEPVPAQTHWLAPLQRLLKNGQICHLLSRTDVAAKLLVGADQVFGSLGDDGLDRAARALVARAVDTGAVRWLRLPGIAATAPVVCERLPPDDPPVLLFGAGHVGRALVGLLSGLPFRLTWADSRPQQMPPELAAKVATVTATDVLSAVDRAPAMSRFLIMTHSHELDFALCHRILQRSDFAYCGLIGSRSKRMRFEHRLRDLGISRERLARLRCPIGVDGIRDKRPLAIAVAVAAELLQLREASALSDEQERIAL